MTKIYPDGVPEIKVQCPNDFSPIELEQKLKKEAESLIGNEMCFDLIEIAREYCESQQRRGKTSFHSEMLKRQEERDKKASDLQAIELQKCEEARQKVKKAEMEELEKKIREELKEKLVLVNENSDFKKKSNSLFFEFETAISVDEQEIKSVKVIGNESNWNFGKSLQVSSENLEFKLKIVNLSHPFLQTFGGRRQLEILLKNIKNHPLKGNENVSRCFGGTIDKENNEMYILNEKLHFNNVTLECIVEQAGSLAIGRVLEYLKQICEGLSHLHSSGLTHRSLNLNCLSVDVKRCLKIEDYLIHKCLSDLAREHGINFENHKNTELEQVWMAPEIASKPNFQSKKVEIWSLGRLTVQMLFGMESIKCWPGGLKELLKYPEGQGLPEAMKEFLKACLAEDAGMRLTAEELLVSKLFIEPLTLTGMISHDFKTKSEVKNQNLVIKTPPPNVTASTSRYLTDFEELEFLGRGGFGSVVKVRNKIDDRFYAVKKIALDPRDVEYNKKILREVTTLSRLHHERIIRYYQAWVEDSVDRVNNEDYQEEDSEYTESSLQRNRTVTFQSKPLDLSLGPKSFKPFNGLEDIDFDDESDDNEGYDDFVQFETDDANDQSDDSDGSDISASDYSNTGKTATTDAPDSGESMRHSKGQVLYIQMEYCPNQTLRDLIDERASDPTSHFLDPPEIWRLFRQIVEGLVHIHAQGMMHRDLKPSNIFLDSNGDVKIGDFGLAVTRTESAVHAGTNGRSDSPMQLKNLITDKSMVSFTGESHTQNIGTPFYVSPEQITSTIISSARYNQKVDMYSLGIILIELWVPFRTGMERVQSLQKCRLPEIILPDDLEEENVIKIAKRLLCHDPKKRFTSLELLRSDLLPPMLEEELMEDAMRSVAQPGAPHYPRLISTIFRRLEEMDVNQIRPKDFAFDVHSGNATEICDESGRIKKEIEKVFLRYGGVEVDPPLLYLPLSESEGYCVLDDAGQRLELPNNLTRPFARWVAQSSLQIRGGCLKRYSINRVFKKISQVSDGQPYQPDEAVFDIVHVDDEKGILEICEVLRVMIDSALAATGCKSEQLVIKVNNLKLRERILRGLRGFEEPPCNFAGPAVQRIGNGVFDEKVLRLLTPIKVDESIESLVQRLIGFYGEMKPLLEEFSDLMTAVQRISIPAKTRVVFDPLMSGPRSDLYKDDFCFVLLKENTERGKRYGGGYEIIGCGGRYNLLVRAVLSLFKLILYSIFLLIIYSIFILMLYFY